MSIWNQMNLAQIQIHLFGKLKIDSIKTNQLKKKVEKELLYTKKELAKNKKASLVYDA